MPIRPENRHRYPANWPDISRAAKEAAGWQCACTGECGRGTHTGRCPNRHGQPAYGSGSTVVLTTAHLNHQPENCDPDNLVPMCQGCHLHYDRDHHRETAAATRRARAESSGQLALFHPDGTLTRWAKTNQRSADDIRRHAEQQRAAVLADSPLNDFIADCWAALAEAARILDPPLHPAITRKEHP